MTREQLINRLLMKYRASGVIGLLNILQDRGLISDEIVAMQDVAERDLIKAYQVDSKF